MLVKWILISDKFRANSSGYPLELVFMEYFRMSGDKKVVLVKYQPKGYVVKKGRKIGSGAYGEQTVVRRVPLSLVPILDEMLFNWVPIDSVLQNEILLLMQELPDFVSCNSSLISGE
jgi:hypothetical protein